MPLGSVGLDNELVVAKSHHWGFFNEASEEGKCGIGGFLFLLEQCSIHLCVFVENVTNNQVENHIFTIKKL